MTQSIDKISIVHFSAVPKPVHYELAKYTMARDKFADEVLFPIYARGLDKDDGRFGQGPCVIRIREEIEDRLQSTTRSLTAEWFKQFAELVQEYPKVGELRDSVEKKEPEEIHEKRKGKGDKRKGKGTGGRQRNRIIGADNMADRPPRGRGAAGPTREERWPL